MYPLSTMMKPEAKITIKQIFEDFWPVFLRSLAYKVPPKVFGHIKTEVEKMLNCGNHRNGFTTFACIYCGYMKTIGFTCKSRFCNRCGKVYTDKWVEKMTTKIFDVPHRHWVFTIPKKLQGLIYWDRSLIKIMIDCAVKTINEAIFETTGKRITPGIIVNIQTFGRDTSFNVHLHILATEGGLDKFNQWHNIFFIPYDLLREKWQFLLLTHLRNYLPKTTKYKKLIDDMFTQYKNGFYINGLSKLTSAKYAAKYLGRYMAKPAIAQSRIINYDKDNQTVTFFYDDHSSNQRKTLTLSVLQFIGRLISHIPPKHFKLVRWFGLYSRRIRESVKKIVLFWQTKIQSLLPSFNYSSKTKNLSFRQRLINSFGNDPLICPNCSNEMSLWQIWHPKYGNIYTFWDDPAHMVFKNERIYHDKKKKTSKKNLKKEFSEKYQLPLPLPAM